MEMIRVIENGKRKRGESHDDDRDGISKLPHEILISIISRLELREAIATRILSSRWRYLCTKEYATRLSFPPFNISNCDASLEDMMFRSRFGNYINMINQIVDSHKNPKVKEFRVRMHSLEGATIQKWLLFALSKQAEIIDIHMDYMKGVLCVAYSFQLINLIMHLPLGFGSLKKLSLSAIVVEDSEIELLLSNSPQLESLSIAWPRRLTKVSVVGEPTFMLKHLEICHASDLESVEICNMTNLVSLKLHYLPPAFVLTLNNVPKLVEFSTCDDEYGWMLCNLFAGVGPSVFSQLHTLKICSSPDDMYPVLMVPLDALPVFKCVKHLELQHAPNSVLNDGFWKFLRLIQTCPSLEELEIELSWPVYTNFQIKDAKYAWAPFPKGELFPSLKKMKFSGFLGNSAELMVVISILNNANSLEELIIEVCDVTEKIRLLATASALEQIQPTLHQSTRLQII